MNFGHFNLIYKGCAVLLSSFCVFFFPLRAAAPPDIRFHLQRLDVLEFVGVPLFDLLIFPRCEEQMSLGDELEEHDAAGRRERGDVSPGGAAAAASKARRAAGGRWPLPVVVSKHGAVAVAKVQTPDLHVSVGRAGCNNCTILSMKKKKTKHMTSAVDQHSGLGVKLLLVREG